MEQTLLSFNRGKVSALSLARIDQKRIGLSAETMTNWIPRTLGPMSLRPGFEYLLGSASNNKARYLPFIFANDDQALIELTNTVMRVIIDDAVVTRASVSTAVTNGTFDTNLTGWTDSDQSGATSAWVTGGYMGLTGDGANEARRDQTLTVSGGDQNVEHALRIVIRRGPVRLRVGSSSGGDEYISEATLETGTHSLAFTPTGGSVYVRFLSSLKRQVLVDSCEIEASGAMTITTPYATADLASIRYDQSGDVIFIACKDTEWKRIERRATTSWSLVRYAPADGPFRSINTSAITMTAGARSGNTTLTASQAYFSSSHVGALFRLTTQGQVRQSALNASDSFTEAIRVTGVSGQRQFLFTITGTWTGAVTLQKSFTSEDGPFDDTSGGSRTANTNEYVTPSYDNTVMWFRAGFKSGAHGSGTATVTLNYSNALTTGEVRVTGYTSATQVSIEVLTDLGYAGAATKQWSEGIFSDKRGWPMAVAFHEGRLWWFGKDRWIGSVSDDFTSFDIDVEGESGPIIQTIGSGPVDTINWGLSVQKLMAGGQGAEFTAQSSALDEPLTPTNFGIRATSTQGSAAVQALQLDSEGVFVQRAGARVYSLAMNESATAFNAVELTSLWPEAGSPGIVRMAIQRQPDTRIHCVRSDGTVLLGVMDRTESVLAWVDIETDGEVEDVAVLNGTDDEDDVYYSIKRTIDGSTVRYLEKWAREDETRGGTLNKQADSFKTYTGAATTSITGLSHLEGESVVVWADGADVGTDSDYAQTYTVSSGAITLAEEASNVVVGLPYTAQWKSSRLPDMPGGGKSLATIKRITDLTLILAWVHAKGLRYGPDFNTLDDLPQVEQGATIDADTIRTTYAERSFIFNGLNSVDARMCLQAQAPRPVTVLAAVPDTSK